MYGKITIPERLSFLHKLPMLKFWQPRHSPRAFRRSVNQPRNFKLPAVFFHQHMKICYLIVTRVYQGQSILEKEAVTIRRERIARADGQVKTFIQNGSHFPPFQHIEENQETAQSRACLTQSWLPANTGLSSNPGWFRRS